MQPSKAFEVEEVEATGEEEEEGKVQEKYYIKSFNIL
jgi:hypothetical protein